MSTNWNKDIALMHEKFGVKPAVRNMTREQLYSFLEFRVKFLEEELNEIKSARSPDDVVDGLIDLCVVAIGTLDAFDINGQMAWDRVLAANMAKEVGIKLGRPNPLGLPDLVKPRGWVAPTHVDNTGLLDPLFVSEKDNSL
jgi:predicted HAD superfamily Cof-like phosphohydrolase